MRRCASSGAATSRMMTNSCSTATCRAAAWRRACFLNASDVGVSLFLHWLQSYGGAMPLVPRTAADLPPVMSRGQVLDCYSQHVKHCPSCSQVSEGMHER